MFVSILGAFALGWSIRITWRRGVAGCAGLDILNPHPLRPIPKGTLTHMGQTMVDYIATWYLNQKGGPVERKRG